MKDILILSSVCAGRNLAGRNANIYCEVMVLDKKGSKLGRSRNSRVIRNDPNPKWNEKLDL